MLLLKKVLLLIAFLLTIPISVNAGVICNDGWESSCVVSGPGCCSHHGGVAGNSSNYSNSNRYYNSDKSEFVENLESGEYAGILTLIILGLPILIGLVSGIKEMKSNSDNDLK